MSPSTRAYLAEFVGTFTLVFIGTAVATLQQPLLSNWGPAGLLGISFAFGGTLLVLVLVIGPVSGCHLNPAVTIPMALSGRLPFERAPGYIAMQFLGALAASGMLYALLRGMPNYALETHGLAANGNPTHMTTQALFGWELLMTAIFLFTIFAATRTGTAPTATALAIGGFLFLAHLVGAQLGDASLNPARSLGPAVWVGGDAMKILWVFLAAPVVGGLAGMMLYKLLYSDAPA